MKDPHPLDRRAFLGLAGGAVAAAVLAGCSSDDGGGAAPSQPRASRTTTTTTTTTALPATVVIPALTARDFEAVATCRVVPEKTAGPFPLDRQLDRRDVTEGVPGRPLRLGLRVLDAGCAPVRGASVEIWHCDATGDYSAYTDNGGGKDEGEGTTFLRGTQTAGDDGIVEFLTIVPGWYSGRAVHIHLRVHLDDETVLTSQLFFEADQIAGILAEGVYADNGLPDTSNESDSIAGDPDEEGTLLELADGATTRGTGSVALLNLGIDPDAISSGGAGGGPGGPPAP